MIRLQPQDVLEVSQGLLQVVLAVEAEAADVDGVGTTEKIDLRYIRYNSKIFFKSAANKDREGRMDENCYLKELFF